MNTVPNSSTFFSTVSAMTRDMRFTAMYYIIGGWFCCATIFGIVVGIPILRLGQRLRDAANDIDTYAESGDLASLESAFEHQRKHYFIQKVFIIISLVIFVIYVIIIAAFFRELFLLGRSGTAPSVS